MTKTPLSTAPRWKRRALLLLATLCARGATPARAADGPTLLKPNVYIGIYQSTHYWSPAAKKFVENTTSWAPSARFEIEGPVNGGSQFSVEFTKPGGKPWMKMDCPTEEIKAGEYGHLSTPRPNISDERKFTTGTGVFGFKIRLKNELAGQNAVVFSGHYTVAKVPKGLGRKGRENVVDYYVNYDAMLPIGYIRHTDEFSNRNPPFSVAMWFKGNVYGDDLAGYLFYKGKQIGSTKDQGSAGTEEERLTTMSNEERDPRWSLWQIYWSNVVKTNPRPEEEPNPHLHYLDKNPGDYEIKVLRAGKLARSAKFTVGPDGQIVDNGLVAANNLGTYRMILPVKILGATDGAWRKTAWKTEAFYGNPLKNFTAP